MRNDGKRRLQQCVRIVLGAMYPRRCPFCGQVLGQQAVCGACKPALNTLCLPTPRLASTEHDLQYLAGAACAYRYAGIAKAAVLRLKEELGAHYAPEMAAHMLQQIFGCTFTCKHGIIVCENGLPFVIHDVVVPVCPSAGKRHYSGQAQLAKYIAQTLNLPLLPHALVHTRPVEKQVGKTRGQRQANLKNAFAVPDPKQVEGKRVLLVDDVITTGTTVSEAARALQKAGALQVFAVAFAETQYHNNAAAAVESNAMGV